MEHIFTVTGMTCGHCERAVQQALHGVDAQAHIQIDRPANKVVVQSEHASREASLRAFAAQRLAGRLFLNVTPTCLLDSRLMNGHTRALLSELGLAANRIVLELTENEQIGRASCRERVSSPV